MLTWVGGKDRAAGRLAAMFPAGVSVASPFIGGGAVEIELERRGHRVTGYDGWLACAEYWKVLLSRPRELADRIMGYYPYRQDWEGARFQAFYNQQEDDLGRAACLFVLSKTVYSGRLFRGTSCKAEYLETKGFTLMVIDRVRRFRAPGLTVEHADFHDSIPRHSDDWLYCDPPYVGREYLYGLETHHQTKDIPKHFDHEGLAGLLRGRDRWVLSYGDCEEVRDLYRDCDIETATWAYGIGSDHTADGKCKVGRELIIRPHGQRQPEKGLFDPALKI